MIKVHMVTPFGKVLAIRGLNRASYNYWGEWIWHGCGDLTPGERKSCTCWITEWRCPWRRLVSELWNLNFLKACTSPPHIQRLGVQMAAQLIIERYWQFFCSFLESSFVHRLNSCLNSWLNSVGTPDWTLFEHLIKLCLSTWLYYRIIACLFVCSSPNSPTIVSILWQKQNLEQVR